jgi:hypothetical protein
VTNAPQSSFRLLLLPACLGLGCLAAPTLLDGQQAQAIRQNTAFRKAPQGIQLGTVLRGSTVQAGRVQGDWREVTLEGWIFTASTSADTREGFDLSVSATPQENLRRAPNQQVLAHLRTGALLRRLESRGAWTRIRRTGWVDRQALEASVTAGAPPDTGRSPPRSPATAAPGAESADRVEILRETPMVENPDGESVGTLGQGVPARVLRRSGDWVRLQLETWVRSEDVAAAAGGVLMGVTAAEVRANPAQYLGAFLEWRVQFISVQEADELRPEIPLGQPYLLTRGPLPEPGFVYVMVSTEQLAQFRTAQPLQEFRVRGRLRAAKTKYLPNPVLELETVVREQP